MESWAEWKEKLGTSFHLSLNCRHNVTSCLMHLLLCGMPSWEALPHTWKREETFPFLTCFCLVFCHSNEKTREKRSPFYMWKEPDSAGAFELGFLPHETHVRERLCELGLLPFRIRSELMSVLLWASPCYTAIESNMSGNSSCAILNWILSFLQLLFFQIRELSSFHWYPY